MQQHSSSSRLPIEMAKQLIEFVSSTNYRLSPYAGEFFVSKESALSFVESNLYDEEEPIHICFDSQEGNKWGCMEVSFNNGKWSAVENQDNGTKATGNTIREMLLSIRESADQESLHCPVELVFSN